MGGQQKPGGNAGGLGRDSWPCTARARTTTASEDRLGMTAISSAGSENKGRRPRKTRGQVTDASSLYYIIIARDLYHMQPSGWPRPTPGVCWPRQKTQRFSPTLLFQTLQPLTCLLGAAVPSRFSCLIISADACWQQK